MKGAPQKLLFQQTIRPIRVLMPQAGEQEFSCGSTHIHCQQQTFRSRQLPLNA